MKSLSLLNKQSSILTGIALVVVTLGMRVWPAILRLTPFGFDHGKDSIAILSMLITHVPKLIGPWTSIPGVFFGPGWYYLLLPSYAVSGGDPVAGVWTLILLGIAQVIFVWRVWGVKAALLVSLAPLYIIISSSAWNPFPMTLISFVILWLSWAAASKQHISGYQALVLGIAASLGFHFSAAFSIFYLPFVLLVPWILCTSKKIIRSASVVLGLLLPFTPQFVFELRHAFVQTKALAAYFSAGEPHSISISKILTVLRSAIGEISLSLAPVANGEGDLLRFFNRILLLILVILYVKYLYTWWQTGRDWQKRWVLTALTFLVFIPIVSFFFLHFNVWYVYGMVPIFTLLAALALSTAPRKVANSIIAVFIIVSCWNVYHYVAVEAPEHSQSARVLAAKESAVTYIAETAGNKPFAVYTYVADIYDYSYQYLWLRRAYQHKTYPSDFSYRPGAPAYATDKAAMLSTLTQPASKAQLVFYIIERPYDPMLFDEWWNAQDQREILTRHNITDEIEVLVTTVLE